MENISPIIVNLEESRCIHMFLVCVICIMVYENHMERYFFLPELQVMWLLGVHCLHPMFTNFEFQEYAIQVSVG